MTATQDGLARPLAAGGDLLHSIRTRIAALHLDLRGLTVATEAATGAYACTAVIAALAGADRVHAVARDTARHGSFADAKRATMDLAAAAGVAHRIDVRRTLDAEILAACHILTNSGHLRPIRRETIDRLRSDAVIALMFEAWEFRDTDLDLAACRARGIRIAAVNERHPDVAVFPFLGPLCVRLLEQAGLSLPGAALALLSDNPFAPFIAAGLRDAGADTRIAAAIGDLDRYSHDAVVVALDPARNPPLEDVALAELSARAPGALLAQFWGDIDRSSAERIWPGRLWPRSAPAPGHMAILLDALGHEPIVRLQTGGLRAAEIAVRCEVARSGGILEFA